MALAENNSIPVTSEIRLRAAQIIDLKIEFIRNDTFSADMDLQDEFVDAILHSVDNECRTPDGLPAHLQRMCDSELLTFDQEQALFHAMNSRKFKADSLRMTLDPNSENLNRITAIETLLAEAQTIRDHIINANTRLVISIVKKFVTTQNTFDEMLSDGLVALMNCVDKFDYDRGFRFSTYAYRSIAREAYRSVKATKLKSTQFTQDGEERVIEQEDERKSCPDGFWNHLRKTAGAMIDQLDRRERFIIRCRYALGSHRKVKSLQFLANKLGVSKERVRQLEIRAVGKLRDMASCVELDDVFGSTVL